MSASVFAWRYSTTAGYHGQLPLKPLWRLMSVASQLVGDGIAIAPWVCRRDPVASARIQHDRRGTTGDFEGWDDSDIVASFAQLINDAGIDIRLQINPIEA